MKPLSSRRPSAWVILTVATVRGFVFAAVCLSVCLLVCLLRDNLTLWVNLYQTWRIGRLWTRKVCYILEVIGTIF